MKQTRLSFGLVVAVIVGSIGPVNAADIPLRAPAPVVAPYSWTGFYAGVNVGYGVGDSPTRLTMEGPFTTRVPAFDVVPHGVVGGGQVGYNWQIGTWVFGAEADIQASGMKSATTCVLGCFGPVVSASLTQEMPWFGTVRGRVGWAMGGLLFYYTGGLAYGKVETDIVETVGPASGSFAFHQTRTGWTYGTGVEAALGGNWTGRVEYLYLDLGKPSGSYTIATLPHSFRSDTEAHIFRVGANYRFGAMPAAPSLMAVPNWAGFYAGGNVGTGLARNSSVLAVGAPVGSPNVEAFDVSPKGILGGVQAGYNWQMANWVYGIEADIQASGQESSTTCAGFCNGVLALSLKQEMPWFGTVRGRLGYSVGPALFYATGGFAYGEVKNEISEIVALAPAAASFSHTKSGYAVGGGIETPMHPIFGLTFPKWTARTEYLYVDLGSVTDTYTAFTAAHTLTTDIRNHVFRTSWSYKFGGL